MSTHRAIWLRMVRRDVGDKQIAMLLRLVDHGGGRGRIDYLDISGESIPTALSKIGFLTTLRNEALPFGYKALGPWLPASIDNVLHTFEEGAA